jgi:sporulation protein YlmC with PRC-barrel domain
MLRSLKDLERYTVCATDGDLGTVVNFLLDDHRWTIRYLVVESGGFLDGRQVLISPIFFREADWLTHRFHLAMTLDKVKHSPGVNLDLPVSRQHEQDYYGYYGYPHYWGGEGIWGMGAYPGSLMAGGWDEALARHSDRTSGDAHLRSARELQGYHVQGTDQEVGHVDDFLVDDETWQIRYLVVDTSHWWFGKKVLVSPHWASRVSWEESKVHVSMTRQEIREGPEWNPAAPVNREYEARLYDYYGRPVYWAEGDQPAEAQSALHAGGHLASHARQK